MRVRKNGYPEITKTFATKALALQWSQRVEYDPGKFLITYSTAGSLEMLGGLIRRYEIEVTPTKKSQKKEQYRVRSLQTLWLSDIRLKDLRTHHINFFKEQRMKEVSSATVIRDLQLLSHILNRAEESGVWRILSGLTPSLLSANPRRPDQETGD